MKEIVALEKYEGPWDIINEENTLFLGGGISGCPNWQAEMAKYLKNTNLVLLNPRRPDFPMGDPEQSVIQIKWEHEHLLKSTAILFWFPCETLCPITLYELGRYTSINHEAEGCFVEEIFVGCHPDYARKIDVVEQLKLSNPHITVVFSLFDLARQVIEWHETR